MGAEQQGANLTSGRWLNICRTLCFVTHEDKVLLMKRAPHRRVFPNKYNGLGGHIERDETPIQGAIREIKEESGLDVDNVKLCGVHQVDTNQETGILLFTFTATTSNPDITVTTDEGTLEWIPIADVTQVDLVEDLTEIIPRALAMQPHDVPYFVHVSYDESDLIILKFS